MERIVAWRSKILDLASSGTRNDTKLVRHARNFVSSRPTVAVPFLKSAKPYRYKVGSPLSKQLIRSYTTEEAEKENKEEDFDDILDEEMAEEEQIPDEEKHLSPGERKLINEERRTLEDMRTEMINENAHTNDPVFSERARNKAYELHKLNPVFWNPLRLSNLFRVNVSRMRLSLWSSKMEEQARDEGVEIDDSVERLLGEAFGELDFPNDIADIPQRIRYKNKRDTYYFLDDEISRASLLKAMRTRDMVHYKESPRLPKKSIPPVKIVEDLLPKGIKPKIYQGKHDGTFIMWDISKSKDLYNRTIVVREMDGSLRTGNWQDRRYVEDYRRFLKWPFKKPFIRPDESQVDHVPEEARLPQHFKVVFEDHADNQVILKEDDIQNTLNFSGVDIDEDGLFDFDDNIDDEEYEYGEHEDEDDQFGYDDQGYEENIYEDDVDEDDNKLVY